MKVVRDEPGKELVLEEANPRGGARVGCLIAVLAPFFLAPLIPLAALGAAKGAPAAVLPVAAAFAALWYAFLGLFIVLILRGSRTLRLLQASRRDDHLQCHEEGILGLFRRDLAIRLADLDGAVLSTVPARGNAAPGGAQALRLELSVRGGGGGAGPRRETLAFAVDELDKREEVMDLAFRIASIAGFPSYRVDENDPRHFRLSLLRRPEAGSQEAPRVERPADYRSDRVGARIEVPDEKIPPFAPSAWQSPYRLEAWSPGREVRFHRPFNALLFGLMAPVLVLTLVAGIAMTVLPAKRRHERLTYAAVGAAFVLGSLGVGFAFFKLARAHECTVDWGAREVRVRRGGSTVALPFADVREIEVKGLRLRRSSGKHSAYYTYRLQVFARARGSSGGPEVAEMLAETRPFREDPDGPYRVGLPLGVELARALGVPYRYVDYV